MSILEKKVSPLPLEEKGKKIPRCGAKGVKLYVLKVIVNYMKTVNGKKTKEK